MNSLNIGLFGFGVVGEGIYQVLSSKPTLNAEVKKVVIKNAEKERNAPSHLFSTYAEEILEDDSIDLVVELIDDAVAAYQIVKRAIQRNKSVVSANKNMVSVHHQELIQLSKKHGVSFLYEAAVCGSVPIIRTLEEYFDNDLLRSVSGILNGSTNYILSQMSGSGLTYKQALEEAQEKGFAESDPTLDVEGIDAAFKLSIICLHAFGKSIESSQVISKGISAIDQFDLNYAKEKGFNIKLLAKCHLNEEEGLQALTVLPTFINEQHRLGQTHNEFNAVLVESSLADEQFFYGKGAGRYPTSTAVLSDISAMRYGYKYEYKKGVKNWNPENKTSATCYISHEPNIKLDTSIFDDLEEEFESKDRAYSIGTIKLDTLRKSGWLYREDVSVISFQ